MQFSFLLAFALLVAAVSAAPSVDVVVPDDGEVLALKGKLHINAYVDGIKIPQDGYAVVWVNRKEVGKFQGNQFVFSRQNPLKVGQHTLTIRVYDTEGNEFEESLAKKTFSVADVPEEEEPTFTSDSPPVASKSSASGDGLSQAVAGHPATFSITLRDEMGRVVLSREPPKLVAVITPAPLKNSLVATPDGDYICTYECEFGSMNVEIGIMLNDEHIIGSPFKFKSNLTHTVVVNSPLPSKPRPAPVALPPPPPSFARSSERVREYFAPQKWMEMGTTDTGGAGRFAYITMITGDDYLIGALLLLHGLRSVGVTDTDIVCMVTENIRDETVATLTTAGFIIARVQKIDIPHATMVEERWSDNYTKLRMWQMLQYDRIIYLDADMLVLNPLDHLFHISLGPANFAAVPDCWLPTFFSAAMFVMKPSLQTYESMTAALPHLPAEESEQTFLNEYFYEAWVSLHYSHNLPKNFGMSPTRFNLMMQRHRSDIRVIHYMGLKPFLCTRQRDCTAHVAHYNVPELWQLWWDQFDEMCSEESVECF